jgi:hypothetical protein
MMERFMESDNRTVDVTPGEWLEAVPYFLAEHDLSVGRSVLLCFGGDICCPSDRFIKKPFEMQRGMDTLFVRENNENILFLRHHALASHTLDSFIFDSSRKITVQHELHLRDQPMKFVIEPPNTVKPPS